MFQTAKKLFKLKYLLIAVTGLLLFSLVFHAIEFHHEHPEEVFGHDLQKAFLHGGDKKYWLLAFLALIVMAGSAVGGLIGGLKYTSRERMLYLSASAYFLLVISKIFIPLREALRRGILHPKLCG